MVTRIDLKQLVDRHLEGRDKGQELAKQLFAALESRVLCLIERQPGYFQFEVQSLREYFAAAYVNQYADPRGVGNSRGDCFDALLARPYWLNTCRFFVGMFNKIEVRGIERSLRELQATPELALHPHMRLAAGRVLDDRAYQGQPSDTVRKIVDFILDGPGVVLAQDGFLDESGQPLTFSEGAGRTQAVLHLQARLSLSIPDSTRRASARMLRRHAETTELTKWWWSKFRPTGDWLRTGADLGVVTASGGGQEEDLAAAASATETKTEWAAELLARGGYTGNADQVLAICKRDIADGAVDVLYLEASTPMGRLVSAARTVTRPETQSNGGAKSRTRFRGTAGRKLVADLVTASQSLSACPAHDADPAVWADRFTLIGQLWSDSWLTRQAIALLPARLDLGATSRHVAQESGIVSALQREEQLRAHHSDADWWRSQWQVAGEELDQRSWLFSMLTAARLSVVLQLADEINEASSTLTPRHYRAMESAIAAFIRTTLARQLALHDPLRRGQVSFSGRSLWLLRLVATDGSGEQIEKKFADAYDELLCPGMGDRRIMMRFLGQRKTTKVDGLRGSRENLPPGAWAAEVKLGAMKAATVSDVLQHPEEWPVEVVGKAIRAESAKVSRLPAIAAVAAEGLWFVPPGQPFSTNEGRGVVARPRCGPATQAATARVVTTAWPTRPTVTPPAGSKT